MRLVFDIETNGLLEDLDKIHSLCIRDVDRGNVWSCRFKNDNDLSYPSVSEGVQILMEADQIIGHNITPGSLPRIHCNPQHCWIFGQGDRCHGDSWNR